MNEREIQRASELYRSGQTLTDVRDSLAEEGYPSRSVNTISTALRDAGVQLRRPGRRKAATM